MGRKKKKGTHTSIKQSKETHLTSHLNGKAEDKPKYTVDDLLERVSQYLENFEYELALKFCDKAIKLAPENTNVLEVYGNVCAETGDVDNARKYFLIAVNLEPDQGHVKYLYLGQLSEGHESVENYEKAIKIMKEVIEFNANNSLPESSDNNLLCQKDISNVYCSIAEIFMTDLCMEENAETLCENYCKLAVEADENNAEGFIVLCNFLLSKNDMEAAKTNVNKAFELWKKTSEICEDNVDEIIPYESRITLIKILMEVECYGKISVIVDQLIEENEDDVRIWYYLGLAKSLLPHENDNPRFYLEKALELYEKTNCDEEEMKTHINELLETCPVEENMETIEEGEEEDEEDGLEGSDENMEDE